jgi:hypothetical protein
MEQLGTPIEVVDFNLILSITTLNVNGVATPDKRQRLSDGILKSKNQLCQVSKT